MRYRWEYKAATPHGKQSNSERASSKWVRGREKSRGEQRYFLEGWGWQRSAELSHYMGHKWHKWDRNSQESEADRDLRQPLVQPAAQNKVNFNIREVVQGLALLLGQICSWLALVGVQRRNPSAASMLWDKHKAINQAIIQQVPLHPASSSPQPTAPEGRPAASRLLSHPITTLCPVPSATHGEEWWRRPKGEARAGHFLAEEGAQHHPALPMLLSAPGRKTGPEAKNPSVRCVWVDGGSSADLPAELGLTPANRGMFLSNPTSLATFPGPGSILSESH